MGGRKSKAAREARPRGRPPRVDPDHGRILTDAELRRRWPGLTADERRLVRRDVAPDRLAPDLERYGTTLRVPTAYDLVALRVVAASEGLSMADLVLLAAREWARAR